MRDRNLFNMNENGIVPQKFNRIPLPIDRYRKGILEVLRSLDKTAIFIGETGSGKSTQIPQFCLETSLASTKIAVTQPRRVAARTLAARVSQERGTPLGELVGYRYRFEDKTSKNTRIVYLTEGVLLREALHSYRLQQYSTIIIDEVHERSVNTDVLLYILRQVQKERLRKQMQPLRLLLMSATMDVKPLAEYFEGAISVYLPGQTFNVRLFHGNQLRAKEDDYLFNAISTVLELHESEPIDSGFLVFLTGQEEIDTAINVLQRAKKNDPQIETICAIPLYAAVPTTIQQRAFEPPTNLACFTNLTAHRKVVFATNIAETSVTIPGIGVVIDSGKVKRRTFTAQNRMDILRVENISKAQAIQRAGRAGRQMEGKCYRLYSHNDYEHFDTVQTPELLRSNISSVLLQMLELGLKKTKSLRKLPDPPDSAQLRASLNELCSLGAIQFCEGTSKQIEITELGKKLLKFPVEPSHAKVLVTASELGCLEEACTVVAFLSAESIFQFSGSDLFCRTERNKFGQDADASEFLGGVIQTPKFSTNDGDHVRYVNIYRAFNSIRRVSAEKLKDFCASHNFNQKRLENVFSIRKQLQELCKQAGLQFNTCTNNFLSLKRAICQGLFLNSCFWDSSTKGYVLERDQRVRMRIHPSSCLLNQQPLAFVYTELVQTNEVYARDICPVQLEWVREQCSTIRDMRIAEIIKDVHIPLVRASPSSSSDSSISSTNRKRPRKRRLEMGTGQPGENAKVGVKEGTEESIEDKRRVDSKRKANDVAEVTEMATSDRGGSKMERKFRKRKDMPTKRGPNLCSSLVSYEVSSSSESGEEVERGLS